MEQNATGYAGVLGVAMIALIEPTQVVATVFGYQVAGKVPTLLMILPFAVISALAIWALYSPPSAAYFSDISSSRGGVPYRSDEHVG